MYAKDEMFVGRNRKYASKVAVFVAVMMMVCCFLMAAAVPYVTGIDLPDSITIERGESLWLDREYSMNSEASEEQIEKAVSRLGLAWASSDTDVLTVDENGNIEALATGSAEISVVDKKGKMSDTCKVEVIVSPTDVVAPESMTLVINYEDSKAINAEILPVDATDVRLIYKSSDENIAVVDEDGNVTAVGNGECVVTATVINTKDADKVYDLSAETTVGVKTAPESISLKDVSVIVGNSKELEVTFTPEMVDVGNQFTWSSGDENILTVDEDGKITTLKAGKVTVTVTNELGQSAECVVTVNKPVATTNPVTGDSGKITGSASNSTAVNKALERGAFGRWRIPSVGVNVAVFYVEDPVTDNAPRKRKQAYTDAWDSAAVYDNGAKTALTMADHNYQGFNAIKKCEVGTKAYIDIDGKTLEFVCTKIVQGTNMGRIKTLKNEDLRDINPNGITCYTCNQDARHVTIVCFEPINRSEYSNFIDSIYGWSKRYSDLGYICYAPK